MNLSVGVNEFFGEPQPLPVCELRTGGGLYDFEMKSGFASCAK